MWNSQPSKNELGRKNCKRQFYRLRYPITRRPTFHLGEFTFAVAEVSEEGMRIFDSRNQFKFDAEAQIVFTGQLEFATETREVSGIPRRRDGKEVVFVDVKGISFRCLLDEQRRINTSFL